MGNCRGGLNPDTGSGGRLGQCRGQKGEECPAKSGLYICRSSALADNKLAWLAKERLNRSPEPVSKSQVMNAETRFAVMTQPKTNEKENEHAEN